MCLAQFHEDTMVTKMDIVDGPALQSLRMIKGTDSKEAVINSVGLSLG